MNIFLTLFLLLGILIGVVGCDDPYHEISSVVADDPKEKLKNAPLDFSKVNELIIKPYCIQCHQQPKPAEGVLLDSYSNVIATLKFSIEEIQSNRMPFERPPLSDELKKILMDWVEAGAPEKIEVPTSNELSL